MDRSRLARPCHDCAACGSRGGGIFEHLGPESLERLNSAKTSHVYRRGQEVFYEGNPCAGVYCVHSGLVKVSKRAPHGRSYILRLAGPGDVLAMESLLLGSPHGASAEMLEEGTVCRLDARELQTILKEEPQLMGPIVQFLAQRLVDADEDRAELSAGESRERIALTLLTLAERYSRPDVDGLHLVLNLSREDLADLIGTTTETAIRRLGELRRKGIVATRGREIVLRDITRLARIARVAPAPIEASLSNGTPPA